MEKAAAPPAVVHREGCSAWAPLVLLFTTEAAVWIVMTFVVLLPIVAPSSPFDALAHYRSTPSYMETAVGWMMLIIYQGLFALLIISIVRTVRTPPGDIPSWLRSDGRSDLHSYSNLLQAVERKKKTKGPRYCRKTAFLKPDRAHYCHDVGSCVLQYQLFSNVFNSPIGFYNYKFYLLSLFYGLLTSAWVVGATIPEVIAMSHRLGGGTSGGGDSTSLALLAAEPAAHIYQTLLRAYEPASLSLDKGETAAVMCVISTLALSALMVLPCAGLIVWHVALIAHGRTAYEWQQARAGLREGLSQFDYGVLNNLALTLGVYPLLWLVPTRTGIEGNGIFFPEKHQAERQW